MAYDTITITLAARPCLVTITHRNSPPEERKALFYGLFPVAEVVAPNPMKGGHPGGQDADVVAVVEFEDGKIIKAPVEDVRLLDSPGMFREYAWGDEEPEETPAPEGPGPTCFDCRHSDLDPQDEPCWSCGGGVHGYKAWEAKT